MILKTAMAQVCGDPQEPQRSHIGCSGCHLSSPQQPICNTFNNNSSSRHATTTQLSTPALKMKTLLLCFSLLAYNATNASPFWLSGWLTVEPAEPDLAEETEIANEEPEMAEEHEGSPSLEGSGGLEEQEGSGDPGRIEKWHSLQFPCGALGAPACPGNINPLSSTTTISLTTTEATTTTTSAATTKAQAGLFGLGITIAGTDIHLRKGNLDKSEKLKPIAVPCGAFPAPACPDPSSSATSPAKGSGGLLGLGIKLPFTDVAILRKGNLEETEKLKPLKFPCGVLPLPACPADQEAPQPPTPASAPTPAPAAGGLLGYGLKFPFTDVEILREGSVEIEEEPRTKAPSKSWWPQGRSVNVDLKWNKLEEVALDKDKLNKIDAVGVNDKLKLIQKEEVGVNNNLKLNKKQIESTMT